MAALFRSLATSLFTCCNALFCQLLEFFVLGMDDDDDDFLDSVFGRGVRSSSVFLSSSTRVTLLPPPSSGGERTLVICDATAAGGDSGMLHPDATVWWSPSAVTLVVSGGCVAALLSRRSGGGLHRSTCGCVSQSGLPCAPELEPGSVRVAGAASHLDESPSLRCKLFFRPDAAISQTCMIAVENMASVGPSESPGASVASITRSRPSSTASASSVQ